MSQLEPTLNTIRNTILSSEPHTFTPLHYQFIRQCLKSRAYNEALAVLDNDIYLILPIDGPTPEKHSSSEAGHGDPQWTPFKYQDLLCYFLYGAMIYLAVGNMERAIHFLEMVIVYPTVSTASLIQVEAYKKWILVHLLQDGKSHSMPRGMNSSTARLLRSIAKPYEGLAEAFKKSDPGKLAAEVSEGQPFWIKVRHIYTHLDI
jgi:COP9 signalosome complex subunit 3